MAQPISITGEIEEGLIFIPDISGFTELVHCTDPATGGLITGTLLSVLIEQNFLNMQVAEIEGDAILFYRFGEAPDFSQLQLQYQLMAKAFEEKRVELERTFDMPIHVSLKAIAHYGHITPCRIGRFEKLYGKVVVEAHRLLKNSIDSVTYLLVTDELLDKIAPVRSDDITSHHLCERYNLLQHICFTYFDYRQLSDVHVA